MAIEDEDTKEIWIDDHQWTQLQFDPSQKVCRWCKLKHSKKGYQLPNDEFVQNPGSCLTSFKSHSWHAEVMEELLFREVCRDCDAIHLEIRQTNCDFDKNIVPFLVIEDYYQLPDGTKIKRKLGMEEEEFHLRYEPFCEPIEPASPR